MKTSAAYLFLDTETTGTNRYDDQIWQISWSLETADHLFADRDFLVHHTSKPSQWTLENTQYKAKMADECDIKFSRQLVLRTLMDDIASATPCPVYLVGANPAFDDFFLRKMTWGVSKIQLLYHYRMIDIENLVMGAFNLSEPPGSADIPAILGLPPPPVSELHDAHMDRVVVRDCFWALRRQMSQRLAA